MQFSTSSLVQHFVVPKIKLTCLMIQKKSRIDLILLIAYHWLTMTSIEHFQLPNDIEFSPKDIEFIWNLRPSHPHEVLVCGKKHLTPRLVQSYGYDYKFSGTVAKSQEIPEIFTNLLVYCSNKYKRNFNQILVNWYRDGKDNIGFHSDDEDQLVDGAEIITVSLGATRDFILKDKKSKCKTVIEASNNMMIVMGGTCQKTHQHSVPKRLRVKEYRISITLREFKHH